MLGFMMYLSEKAVSSGGYVRNIQQIGKNNNPSIPYGIYIYNMLKQVHPSVGSNAKAMSITKSLINDISERIANEAQLLQPQEQHMCHGS